MSACCPEHDPIRWARFLVCVRCGQIAWPTDAAWIGCGLILATYAPACPHAQPVTVVTGPYRAAHRCIAFTREGLPCRGTPMRWHGNLCRPHWDANERLLARQQEVRQ